MKEARLPAVIRPSFSALLRGLAGFQPAAPARDREILNLRLTSEIEGRRGGGESATMLVNRRPAGVATRPRGRRD